MGPESWKCGSWAISDITLGTHGGPCHSYTPEAWILTWAEILRPEMWCWIGLKCTTPHPPSATRGMESETQTGNCTVRQGQGSEKVLQVELGEGTLIWIRRSIWSQTSNRLWYLLNSVSHTWMTFLSASACLQWGVLPPAFPHHTHSLIIYMC